jgi:hypothetical protein
MIEECPYCRSTNLNNIICLDCGESLLVDLFYQFDKNKEEFFRFYEIIYSVLNMIRIEVNDGSYERRDEYVKLACMIVNALPIPYKENISGSYRKFRIVDKFDIFFVGEMINSGELEVFFQYPIPDNLLNVMNNKLFSSGDYRNMRLGDFVRDVLQIGTYRDLVKFSKLKEELSKIHPEIKKEYSRGRWSIL